MIFVSKERNRVEIAETSQRMDKQSLATGLARTRLIDVHVHFREPGQTHKEDIHTEALAAARWFYWVVMMANTNPTISDIATFRRSLSFCSSQGKSSHSYGCDGYQELDGQHLTDFEGRLRPVQ